MKKILTILFVVAISTTITFAQKHKADSSIVDPINKLAPNNKPITNDSIAVMTAEEVAVTASKKDVKKAKKLLAEQEAVGELTRELIEHFKFRFEPYYCRYRTDYRSQGFLGIVRCFGGEFCTSLAYIPINNEEYREFSDDMYGGSYTDEVANTREHVYTNFSVENIREIEEEENMIGFDVVLNQPVTIDGRSEDNLKFMFKFNYKNGKMCCFIEGDNRHYAKYYGYMTTLR